MLQMRSIEEVLEKVPNKKMLVVFPHPDDESVMAGGLILRAIEKDWQVSVLTLTEGGRGKIHVHGRGRSAQEIRRAEEVTAMAHLGVTDWIMWTFEDGHLRKQKGWRGRLKRFVRMFEPGVVVSYDLSGVSAHPDHICVSHTILRLARKKGFKLLWPAFVDELVDERVRKYTQKPEWKLRLTLFESIKKWKAVFANKSQRLEEFVGLPIWLAVFRRREEYFSEMKPDKKYKYRYVKFKL